MLKLIASVDRNWGLGLGQELLFHIPEDMQWFRGHTMGKTVILGRKTLESFPGGGPLKGRKHLLLSRKSETKYENVFTCQTPENVLQCAAQEEEVWVIGGEQIYQLFLPYCEEAFVTKVDAVRPADKFLENLDASPDWRLIEQSPWRESEGLRFCFCVYQRC